MREIFVPANISKVTTLDPGEIRLIELTLPKCFDIDHVTYQIRDAMRPGTAFFTKPFGSRTGKIRRRMYTRSNCSATNEYVLQTIINYTHEAKADTSLWWQSDDVLRLQSSSTPLEVRVDWNKNRSCLMVYENSSKCSPSDLRLEPDGQWENMRFVGIAFSTGITPFLAHLRYMRHHQFGRRGGHSGMIFTLVASVRNPNQLMAHEEMLELEAWFPDNFHYHPVLTREWPDDWQYTKGRIIRAGGEAENQDHIDLTSLLKVVPDLSQRHVRLCGNKIAQDQLKQGMAQMDLTPLSFRAEAW